MLRWLGTSVPVYRWEILLMATALVLNTWVR